MLFQPILALVGGLYVSAVLAAAAQNTNRGSAAY